MDMTMARECCIALAKRQCSKNEIFLQIFASNKDGNCTTAKNTLISNGQDGTV